ncbi:MAG: hypothetical protein IPM70_13935 [Proteobacteria bacterium]|nr:hypothetical protein [Pseudomonadota bacterium]
MKKGEKMREYRITRLMEDHGRNRMVAKAYLKAEDMVNRKRQSVIAKDRNHKELRAETRGRRTTASERIDKGARPVQGGAPGLKQRP